MVRQVPEVTRRRQRRRGARGAAGRHAPQTRGVDLPREYLEEDPESRRAPAPARSCAHEAVALLDEAEQVVRQAIALRAGLPRTCTRTSAASWRCSGASRKPSPSFRPAIHLDPRLPLAHKKLGAGAGGARPRRARRTRRSKTGSSRIRTGSRSRSRSITCARAARTRPSRRCARRCARIPTTSTPCTRSRRSTGATRSGCPTPRRCCAARRACAPGYVAAWMMLGTLLHDSDRHRGSDRAATSASSNSSRTMPPPGRGSARTTRRSATWRRAPRPTRARSRCSRACPAST